MSTAAATPSPASPSPSGGKSKIIPVFLALNSLLLIGVLAVLLLKPAAATAPAPAATAESAEATATAEGAKAEGKDGAPVNPELPGPQVKLPDFVVRLRNPEIDRFARVSFELELRNEGAKTRLTERMPRIRDAFIAYLSDLTLEELRGSEGLARTKQGLTLKLHELLSPSDVRGLYITDFVVQ